MRVSRSLGILAKEVRMKKKKKKKAWKTDSSESKAEQEVRVELGGHITLFKNTDQKGREEAVIRKGQWIEEGMAFFPLSLGEKCAQVCTCTHIITWRLSAY